MQFVRTKIIKIATAGSRQVQAGKELLINQFTQRGASDRIYNEGEGTQTFTDMRDSIIKDTRYADQLQLIKEKRDGWRADSLNAFVDSSGDDHGIGGYFADLANRANMEYHATAGSMYAERERRGDDVRMRLLESIIAKNGQSVDQEYSQVGQAESELQGHRERRRESITVVGGSGQGLEDLRKNYEQMKSARTFVEGGSWINNATDAVKYRSDNIERVAFAVGMTDQRVVDGEGARLDAFSQGGKSVRAADMRNNVNGARAHADLRGSSASSERDGYDMRSSRDPVPFTRFINDVLFQVDKNSEKKRTDVPTGPHPHAGDKYVIEGEKKREELRRQHKPCNRTK